MQITEDGNFFDWSQSAESVVVLQEAIVSLFLIGSLIQTPTFFLTQRGPIIVGLRNQKSDLLGLLGLLGQ